MLKAKKGDVGRKSLRLGLGEVGFPVFPPRNPFGTNSPPLVLPSWGPTFEPPLGGVRGRGRRKGGWEWIASGQGLPEKKIALGRKVRLRKQTQRERKKMKERKGPEPASGQVVGSPPFGAGPNLGLWLGFSSGQVTKTLRWVGWPDRDSGYG